MIIEAYWIVGLPGTTYASMMHNLQTAEQLIDNNVVDALATSTVFTPLPGTPIFHQPELFNLKIKNQSWDSYIRHHYKPVYSLSEISQNQILSYLLLFESTLLNAYCRKVGIEEEEIVKTHKELFSK